MKEILYSNLNKLFGKFKGKDIENIPDSYLEWVKGEKWFQTREPKLYENIKKELAYRDKFDLHVFGNDENGWRNQGIKNVHPAMFDKNLSDLYGQSKIVIAISNAQIEGYWSIRSTQALMCGAFCLVRFTPQMEKEIKDNVVYFQTISDCLEKIDYYLKNEEPREKIAQQGYEFAKRNLTISQRVKELIILFENRDSIL